MHTRDFPKSIKSKHFPKSNKSRNEKQKAKNELFNSDYFRKDPYGAVSNNNNTTNGAAHPNPNAKAAQVDIGSNKGQAADEKPEFVDYIYEKKDPRNLSVESPKKKASNTLDCRIYNEILNGGGGLEDFGGSQ